MQNLLNLEYFQEFDPKFDLSLISTKGIKIKHFNFFYLLYRKILKIK